MGSSEPARPPSDFEQRAFRRRRRRESLNAAAEVAWVVLSWMSVAGMAALVVLLVLTILLCAGLR